MTVRFLNGLVTGTVAISFLMLQDVVAQPLGPEELRGLNQMPSPSFEEEGLGGEGHALGGASASGKPTLGHSHSG